MKLETLNEFVVLADFKSYTKAAEALFIAQSTLTKHIQQLEAELGLTLINRGQYNFSLTRDGIFFYEYARKIVALKQNYMAQRFSPTALNEMGFDFGTGYLSDDEHMILTDAISDFSALYPYCPINTFRFTHMSHCRTLLRNGDISLAVVKYSDDSSVAFSNTPQSEYERIPLFRVPMVAVLPENHPLTSKTIFMTDLAQESFLFGARNSFRFHNCYSACLGAGFEPRVAYTFDKPEAIITFIERGKGVSIAPETLMTKFPERKVHIAHFDPPIEEKTDIICIKNTSSYSLEKQFVSCIMDAVRKSGYRKYFVPQEGQA
ncbi:MAG: LysR family transcriptional regulator [Oscillospiraceae bacterium]